MNQFSRLAVRCSNKAPSTIPTGVVGRNEGLPALCDNCCGSVARNIFSFPRCEAANNEIVAAGAAPPPPPPLPKFRCASSRHGSHQSAHRMLRTYVSASSLLPGLALALRPACPCEPLVTSVLFYTRAVPDPIFEDPCAAGMAYAGRQLRLLLRRSPLLLGRITRFGCASGRHDALHAWISSDQ